MEPAHQPRHWRAPDISPSIEPRISYYPPGLRQLPHNHHRPHVSVVLGGSMIEEIGREETFCAQGTIIFRADGARHGVRFGPAGAVILSMEQLSSPPVREASGSIRVRPRRLVGAQLVARVAEGAASEALAYLIGLQEIGDAHCTAASWLPVVAGSLIEAPWSQPIEALARGSSLHPGHFSRAFAHRFGVPPSLFRRQAMAAHAIVAIITRAESLAEAALSSGFFDQSHMSRAIVEAYGLTPGRLRRMFDRDAISVQFGSGPLR